MTLRHLLAIDPGGMNGHTGIVWFAYSADFPAQVKKTWALPGTVSDFCIWWTNNQNIIQKSLVLYESFQHSGGSGVDVQPLRIEGAIHALSYRDNIATMSQRAAGKNTAVTNEILKRMNMWFTGDHHHDRTEAARHGLIWFKNQNHLPTLRAMYPDYAK